MYYNRKGKKCSIEGCCLPSRKYCEPESPLQSNKPDTIYPGLFKELRNILFNLPCSIALFIYDMYSFSILKKPKRPTWTFATALTVAIMHTFRSLAQSSSISIWRVILSLPYRLSSMNGYYKASFTASILNLPGILKAFDSQEDGTRVIEAQWLFPLEEVEEDSKNSKDKEEKVMLYLHGGGFCGTDWGAYLNLSKGMSQHTNIPIFCVNYRVAPETRFPGAVVDVVQSYFHLINYYKISPQNIIFFGDSAGGGLAVTTQMYLRDHGFPLPNSSILMSPWIDLSYSHQSWLHASKHDILPPRPHMESLINPARFYLGPSQYQRLCKHPYASPLFASNFEHLPPILIQCGGSETMTDEVRAFFDKLKTCKYTLCRYEEYEDMIHDFQAYPVPKARLAFQNVQKWISDLKKYKNGGKNNKKYIH